MPYFRVTNVPGRQVVKAVDTIIPDSQGCIPVLDAKSRRWRVINPKYLRKLSAPEVKEYKRDKGMRLKSSGRPPGRTLGSLPRQNESCHGIAGKGPL